MKVAIISRSDQTVGGASRAAAILAALLRDRGHQADHWVSYINAPSADSHQLIFPANLRKIAKYSRILSGLLGLFDVVTPDAIYFAKHLKDRKYDIVHLHDVVKTISPWTIAQLARVGPVVQTLHDCSPFTGGCIYPGDCARFIGNCGTCPELKKRTWPMHMAFFDGTGLQQSIKRRCYRDVHLVAPCRWMQRLAMESHKFSRKPIIIFNGVDEQQFRPLNQEMIRQMLGLPQNRKVVIYVSTSVDDRRKGFAYAIEALRHYRGDRPLFLIIGHPPAKIAFDLSGLDYRMLGFICDLKRIMFYLAASDVLLFPTLQDNAPFVLLESMAVGTPSVTFDTGGVGEIVLHGKCGYVAAKGDIPGLSAGLQAVLGNDEVRREWRACARTRIESCFSYNAFIDKHLELYDKISERS